MAILTVTLNPALDLDSSTPHLTPGDKLRCAEPVRDPGGGGINVARAVALLGGEALAVLAVGGPTGDHIAALLRAKGVPIAVLPAPGETRANLSMTESTTGKQYRFIFPGPTWSAPDVATATEALLPLVRAGDYVVLSGSLPPGITPQHLVGLVQALSGAGAKVVADTSGAALTALSAAQSGLSVLRMDSREARELTGRDLRTQAESAQVATNLSAQGAAEIVILARGAEGSVLATRSGRWFAPAVDVPVVSLTGAGDSFVAGLVLALSRGLPFDQVLQWGCAAASSAVGTPATDLCDRTAFDRILPLSAATPI